MNTERKSHLPSQPHVAAKLGSCIVKILDELVNMAILTILLLLLIYGSFVLWQTNQVYQAANSQEYAMYRPSTTDEGMSFATLQQFNPDVFSWLTIYGTNIDYPVAHTDNNETYVNTDIMGDFSVSGSLFLDYNNAPDFSDFSSIIYGHHMEKDAMFGSLSRFMEPGFLEAHAYGNLFFDGKDHGIEFFAFLEVDAYNDAIYTAVVPDGREEPYLANLIAHSAHRRDIAVSPQEHIVLLSTCTSDSTYGRHILVGKITDTTHQNLYQNDTAPAPASASAKQIKQVGSPFASALTQGPWQIMTIPLILIILIILYIIITIKERKGKYEANSKKKT